MKKSILICAFLIGGGAVAFSVSGQRDDVARAAETIPEEIPAEIPAEADVRPAPARRGTVQNVKLVFQLGEDKHYSVVCANGEYSLLHREGTEEHSRSKKQTSDQSSGERFELHGALSLLPQGDRLYLTYQASWEFGKRQNAAEDDRSDDAPGDRSQRDTDGEFAVSGNLAVRHGQTYTLGSFGDTKLTVRVVIGEEAGSLGNSAAKVGGRKR
jgi:hypothetical protein